MVAIYEFNLLKGVVLNRVRSVLSAAAIILLHRRAGHCPITAVYAAVT